MTTLVLPLSPQKSLKRPFSETGLDSPFETTNSQPTTNEPQGVRTAMSDSMQASACGQPSTQCTDSGVDMADVHISSVTASPNPLAATVTNTTNPPKKRTKMTESEKEAKRLEKEAKDKEKAEQKAKRDEDKRRKDEEKAKKEEEKQEEKRVKDAEKEKKRLEKEEQVKFKEAERKRKEEEKEKKQKSQLRLNAFFVPPTLNNNDSTPSSPHGSISPTLSRRGSISSIRSTDALARERSVSATPSKRKISEYERQFPSFFLQSHTILAPQNRFERDSDGLLYAQTNLDIKLSDAANENGRPRFNPHEMLHLSPYKRRKLNGAQPSVKEIVERLNGSSYNPIDLTDPYKLQSSQGTSNLLKSVSTRILKFAEDIRPPYVGTYTRLQNPVAARKICRNPFVRCLPTTDYDYDSEAEWEEPGEGEDLDSEGEEDVESEDGDDMDGFLDDEDTAEGPKRRLLTSTLEPTSTGICWEDSAGHQALPAMSQYRLETILDSIAESPKVPIDPYSIGYWEDTNLTSAPAPRAIAQTTMAAPRIPLNTLDRTNYLLPPLLDGIKMQQLTGDRLSNSSKGPKKMVSPEVLEEFKRAVEGSDMTKVGLIELLKKQFPKQSKDAIKDTLAVVAERVGSKGQDKKWVIKRDLS
ncbi:MAG: hypothetical protein Q9218_007972 [Villophora microphyllina]